MHLSNKPKLKGVIIKLDSIAIRCSMRIMLFFLWIGIIHNVLGDSQSLYIAQDTDSNNETLETIDVRSAWDISSA